LKSENVTDAFTDFCKAPGKFLSDVLRKGGRVPRMFSRLFKIWAAEVLLNLSFCNTVGFSRDFSFCAGNICHENGTLSQLDVTGLELDCFPNPFPYSELAAFKSLNTLNINLTAASVQSNHPLYVHRQGLPWMCSQAYQGSYVVLLIWMPAWRPLMEGSVE
jgi:hypothetical protein